MISQVGKGGLSSRFWSSQEIRLVDSVVREADEMRIAHALALGRGDGNPKPAKRATEFWRRSSNC